MPGKNSKLLTAPKDPALTLTSLLPFALGLILVCCIEGRLPISLPLTSSCPDLIAHPWQVFTYGIVHRSPVHLMTSLLVLALVGLSGQLSARCFYATFASAVVVGGLVFVSVYGGLWGRSGVLSGSSAGICGLIPSVLFLEPMRKEVSVRMLSRFSVALLALADIVYSLVTLYPGFWAHVGGYLTGGVCLCYWRKKLIRQRARSEAFQKVRVSGYASLTETERAILSENN